MDQFIKLQSSTSTPFTSSQNLVDFSIPDGDVYDFSSSYINLRCRVGAFTLQSTENINGSGSAIADKNGGLTPIVNVNPVWNSTSNPTRFDNCSLVKNVYLDSSRKGRIEDIRRSDILFTNLKRFTKPTEDDTNMGSVDFATTGERVGSWKWGLSTELEKEGTIMSKQRSEWDVKIPLKDVLGIGSAKEIDSSKTGGMRLNMELNIAKIASMSEFQGSNTDVGSVEMFKANQIVNGVASITSLTIQGEAEFCDANRDSPYYTGMPIIITATGAGGASNILASTTITGITFNVVASTSDGGTAIKRKNIVLTLAESVGSTSTASHSYSSVVITPRLFTTAGAPSLEFSDAQLVLAKVGAPQGADQINYFSYSTEEGNGNSLTSFNKQFQLERECVSSMLLFPDETDQLNSHNDNLTSYRTRTNNEDNTDRQITFDKPLEHKCLGDGLMNMGLKYRDYRKIQFPTNKKTYVASVAGAKKIRAIVDSHPPTQTEKLYQVNIEATSTGVKSYALFKQIPKSLVY